MEQVKECARVTIRYTMQINSPDGTTQAAPSCECGFVYGVDAQYPSVETALRDKRPGDRVKVRVPAEEMFGAYCEDLVRELPREDYKQARLKPGKMYREMKKKMLVQFMVKELREDVVVADFNDPRAGTWAEFDIVVTEVRPATESELAPSCAKPPEMPKW